jgi:acetylornithine deacetylase/succinyl-diaminopimelate desuccinylase-like protein
MDPIPLLTELIAIDSVNPYKTVNLDSKVYGLGREGPMAERLEVELERLGFSVRRQLVTPECVVEGVPWPARYNVLAEKGTGDSSLLFFGHMDTVEVSKDSAEWQREAFQASIRKDSEGRERLYGLGANDMKGGLAAILAGLEGVQPKGYKLKVAFLVDEECWSFGAVALLEEGQFLADVKHAIVPEVGDFDNKTEHPSMILGRMGRCEYRVSVQGRSCHGAQACVTETAVNAVYEASRMIVAFTEQAKTPTGIFRHGAMSIRDSQYVSRVEGGACILSVPESACFYIDRSFVPGEDMKAEEARLTRFFKNLQHSGGLDPALKFEVALCPRPTEACQPYFIKPEEPFVCFVSSKIEQLCENYEYGIAWSVADENRFVNSLGIPTLVLGPKGKNCHASHEWVDVESLRILAALFHRIAAAYPGP